MDALVLKMPKKTCEVVHLVPSCCPRKFTEKIGYREDWGSSDQFVNQVHLIHKISQNVDVLSITVCFIVSSNFVAVNFA